MNQDQVLFDNLSKTYEETTGHKLPEAKKYPAGSEIYAEGQVPKGIYYLKKGTVKISYNTHEEPVVVRLVRAHKFMGYVSLIKRWDYDTTATVVEPSEIYFIPKEFFLTAIEKNMKFVQSVLDILCTQISEDSKFLTELLTKTVKQRLAILLLTLDHSPIDGKVVMMKKEIASILNIKPETLSRNLLYLQSHQAIHLLRRNKGIEITSRERLLKLSRVID